MNGLKTAIKSAINFYCKKWTAKKVWSIEVTQSSMDEETGEGEMVITVQVKKRKKNGK